MARGRSGTRWGTFSIGLLLLASSAVAQRKGELGGGSVSQRQTRDQAASNSRPLIRLSGRIETRVHVRLKTRIDRDYNQRANALSAFKAADDQARSASRAKGLCRRQPPTQR